MRSSRQLALPIDAPQAPERGLYARVFVFEAMANAAARGDRCPMSHELDALLAHKGISSGDGASKIAGRLVDDGTSSSASKVRRSPAAAAVTLPALSDVPFEARRSVKPPARAQLRGAR